MKSDEAKINGLSHITFSVKSLSDSLQFYRDLLGYQLVAKWKNGAYLIAGDLWLCLIEDGSPIETYSIEYSHIAFHIDDKQYTTLKNKLVENNVPQWKQNKSYGESIYISDPDNHKLEIHTANLISRIAYLKKYPYSEMEIDSSYLNLRTVPIPECLNGKNISIMPMNLSHATEVFRAGQIEKIWTWLPRGKFESMEDVLYP